MSLREKNRDYFCNRVLIAAKSIIEKEGAAKLTLRHLAEVAEVDPKTPANLFGNKAGIFLALLQEPLRAFTDSPVMALKSGTSHLKTYIGFLDLLNEFMVIHESYFKEVSWGLLVSRTDHSESKIQSKTLDFVKQIESCLLSLLVEAQSAGELSKDAPIESINQNNTFTHISSSLAWANGFVSFSFAIENTKSLWIANLLRFASPKGKKILNELSV